MIALMFGIGLLSLIAIMDFFYRRELKNVRRVYGEEISDLVNEKVELEVQCHTVEVYLEQEIEALMVTLDDFEAAKDPDSMFPSMESSMAEVSAKANLQLLLKLRDDLFPPTLTAI